MLEQSRRLNQACTCHASSRRAVITGLVCSLALPLAASAQFASPIANDERFMREAQKADFPFGAVIVRNGEVIARGGNHGRSHKDPTAHGEMTAIRNAIRIEADACLHRQQSSELR